MQYIQDITRLIYEYNLEIERFLTKNKSGSVGFTPPRYQRMLSWNLSIMHAKHESKAPKL